MSAGMAPAAILQNRQSGSKSGISDPGSSWQGVWASRRDQPLRDPVVDMREPDEWALEELDGGLQRKPIELHVGEVLEQDVGGVGRAVRALELLSGQDR